MQKPLNILFLGANNGNSRHRVLAMGRLGHQVFCLNPDQYLPTSRITRKLHFETGGVLAEAAMSKKLLAEVPDTKFDLVWVDKGRYVGPKLVRTLRERYGRILNYNTDDPLGKRDRYSWMLYRRAIPEYSLLSFNRKENIAEATALGAKRVIIEFRTADEIAHRPRQLSPEELAKWSNDVVFVGTGMEKRGAFMMNLIDRNVPLKIYGNSWERQPEWSQLQGIWKGPGTTTPEDYSASILGAKICLGLLSYGNRDLHTRRSIEVPALGGLLCAERTSEHLELYVEGEEAVFWKDAEECADVCLRLLADEPLRAKIARQGHERCLRNGHFNEQFCQRLIDAVLQS